MRIQAHRLGYYEWVLRFKFSRSHGFSIHFGDNVPRIEMPTLHWEE